MGDDGISHVHEETDKPEMNFHQVEVPEVQYLNAYFHKDKEYQLLIILDYF